MKGISVTPGVADSLALEDIEEPPGPPGGLVVRTIAVGICGTDMDIVGGGHAEAPKGENRLILGHESFGVVEEAPSGVGFAPGDHVVGIVRRPDPVPCPCCAAGNWDMCANGMYRERGIKGLHGFAATRFLLEPEFAVHVDPALGILGVLLEPASILAKAWRRADAMAQMNCRKPERALVTGAGPIGLLAALFGVQRGLDVHVLDRVTSGPKPALVEALGATYHTGTVADACNGADITIECTGVGDLAMEAIAASNRNGVVCLTGVSSSASTSEVDTAGFNRNLVLENDIVFGSVNANRSHYEHAARTISDAEPGWLAGLITRRVPLDTWRDAYTKHDGDVKTILMFDEPAR